MRAWLTAFVLTCASGAVAASAMSGGAGDDQRSRRPSRSGGECFSTRFVTDFRPVNRDQVDITVSASRVYRLDLGPGCFDIDWANRIALVSRTGSYICGALDAEIVSPSIAGGSHCIVTGMRRLSDEEVLAGRARRHR